jgi:hypothetical protein
MIVVMCNTCHCLCDLNFLRRARISIGTCAMHATANSCDLNYLRRARISIGTCAMHATANLLCKRNV